MADSSRCLAFSPRCVLLEKCTSLYFSVITRCSVNATLVRKKNLKVAGLRFHQHPLWNVFVLKTWHFTIRAVILYSKEFSSSQRVTLFTAWLCTLEADVYPTDLVFLLNRQQNTTTKISLPFDFLKFCFKINSMVIVSVSIQIFKYNKDYNISKIILL